VLTWRGPRLFASRPNTSSQAGPCASRACVLDCGIVYDCMTMRLPPIGSTWLDRDPREKRTVQVIRYDAQKRRVRIHCIETDVLSWAKPERFNGKSGGYARIERA
jgi:hypothetical protein